MKTEVPILALKPRAEVTRSPKYGYQWPHKEDLCPPKKGLKTLQLLYLVLYEKEKKGTWSKTLREIFFNENWNSIQSPSLPCDVEEISTDNWPDKN